MPIRLRFLLFANAFLVGLGIVGFIAITNLDRASDRFSEAAHQSIDHVALSDQLRATIPDLRTLELEYVMNFDPAAEPALLVKMDARRKSLRQVMTHNYQDGKGGAVSSCGLCHRTSQQAMVAVSYQQATSPPTATSTVPDASLVSLAAGQVLTPTSVQGCISCHQVFKRFLQMDTQFRQQASKGHRDEAFATYQASEGQYTTLLNQAESFRQAQYAVAPRTASPAMLRATWPGTPWWQPLRLPPWLRS